MLCIPTHFQNFMEHIAGRFLIIILCTSFFDNAKVLFSTAKIVAVGVTVLVSDIELTVQLQSSAMFHI